MARDLANQDNVDAPNGENPSGKIRDFTTLIPGTSVDEKVYGDFHQFTQKIMRDANIVANDLEENTTNGFQLNEALQLNQGLSSFFSSNSSNTGNVGKFTKIYTLEFDVSFLSQRLSFDLYSVGNNGTRIRSISVDINIKATQLPYVAFDQVRDLGIQVTKSSRFVNDDIAIVLTDDSTTKKVYEIYVKFQNEFEAFGILTRTNIGGSIKQNPDSGIVATVPAGTKIQIGWSKLNVIFTAGFANGARDFEYLDNGDHVLLRGSVKTSLAAATPLGTILTFPVLEDTVETIVVQIPYGAGGPAGPDFRGARIGSTANLMSLNFAGSTSTTADDIYFDNIRIDK